MAGEFTGQTDLTLTFEGDLDLSSGDLATSNSVTWLSEVINMVLRTSPGEYAVYPAVGGSLDEFIGEQNTRATADKIRERITNSLTYQPWANPGRLGARVVPTGKDTIAAFITLDLPTGSRIYVDMLDFGYSESGTVIRHLKIGDTPDGKITTNMGSQRIPENKYLRRIWEAREGNLYQ